MRRPSVYLHESHRPALRVLLTPALLIFLGMPHLIPIAMAQTAASVYNSAVQKIRSGNFKGGCAEAQLLAEKVPRFFGSYNLLGMCAMERGEIGKAEENFRRSIELNP